MERSNWPPVCTCDPALEGATCSHCRARLNSARLERQEHRHAVLCCDDYYGCMLEPGDVTGMTLRGAR